MWKLPATLEDGERLGKDAFVGALEDETTEYALGLGLGLGLGIGIGWDISRTRPPSARPTWG